jgi:hypothetical protein
MKRCLCVQTLAGCVIALKAITVLSQPSYVEDVFFCDKDKNKGNHPTTFARTSRGNIPIIRWVDKSFPDPWTPQKRCEEISIKLQRFYDNGTLKYLKAGTFNGQPVLCIVDYKGGSCRTDGVLVTLKPEADPQLTIGRIMDRRELAKGRPIDQASEGKWISEVNHEIYFNIDTFLNDEEDS